MGCCCLMSDRGLSKQVSTDRTSSATLKNLIAEGLFFYFCQQFEKYKGLPVFASFYSDPSIVKAGFCRVQPQGITKRSSERNSLERFAKN